MEVIKSVVENDRAGLEIIAPIAKRREYAVKEKLGPLDLCRSPHPDFDDDKGSGSGFLFVMPEGLETDVDYCWVKDFLPPIDGHFHTIEILEEQTDSRLEKVEVKQQKIEEPLYTYNGYNVGLVDCMMTVSLLYPYIYHAAECVFLARDSEYTIDHGFVAKGTDLRHYDNKTKGSEKRYRNVMFKLLVEIKPYLDRIGATIGQTKIYRNSLPVTFIEANALTILVVTYANYQ
jgi:hypothetical protein